MSSANETGAATTAAGTSKDELPVLEPIDLEAAITVQEATILLPILDEAIATSAVQDMVRAAYADKDPKTLDGSTAPVTIGEALKNAAGSPVAAALSAVDSAATGDVYLTIGDILGDASSLLCKEKMVAAGDAAKVQAAEASNNDVEKGLGGVTSAMQQAAGSDENTGSA